MIAAVSKNIATYLGNRLITSQDQVEVYEYGLQILLGAMIKVVLIVFLSWALNTFNITLVLFLVFAAFRCFGGGAHLSTYPRCLIFGTSIIVGLGLISQFHLDSTVLKVLFISNFIFAIYACIKWVPAGTEKKQFTCDKVCSLQKKKLLILIIIWSFMIVYLMGLAQNTYVLAVILGAWGSLSLITPWGYQLLATIDKLADMKGGERYV